MNALLESFLDYISLERGLSINTRKAYADDIGQFLNELTRRGVSSLNQVSRKQILDHLMAMKSKGMSTNSISRHLVSIKVFFRYLQQEGLLDRNVTDTMDSPKLWKILPDTLSEKEVDRLLVAPDMHKPLGVRDRAILELLYATGLRVSELSGLQLADLHLDEGYNRCIGQGGELPQTTRSDKIDMRKREGTFCFHLPASIPPRPAAALADHQGIHPPRRHHEKRDAPHAAPFVCQPPAAERRAAARDPGDARSCRHLHHPGLHPCEPGTPQVHP